MPGLAKGKSRKQSSWETERTGEKIVQPERHQTVPKTATPAVVAGAQTINYLTLPQGKKASLTYIQLSVNTTFVNTLRIVVDDVTVYTFDVNFPSIVFQFTYQEAIIINRKIDLVVSAGAPGSMGTLNTLHILEDASSTYYV